MDEQRQCGGCTVCCVVAEVKEGVVDKPACKACPFLNHGCKLIGQPDRPQVCRNFQCSWLRGYGNENDRPNKSGVMVSINQMNGGNWIMVMDVKKDAHKTTGKNIIIDVATKVDLPIIIVAFGHLETGKGNFVIVKKSLESRSRQIIGTLIDEYTDTMNIYKLIIH